MEATPLYPVARPKEILMEKRERIKLERAPGDRVRAAARDAVIAWFDSKEAPEAILERVPQLGYTGLVLYPENVEALLPRLPARMLRVLHVADAGELEGAPEGLVIASPDPALLELARGRGRATCLRAHVDDGQSLHQAIARGAGHDYLAVGFRDPTNIPLELVIASLQGTKTVLIKEISSPDDVDDAVVSLGVMEVGAEGVMFSPRTHEALDGFFAKLDAHLAPAIRLEVGTVVRSVPVGMGYRSCIDLATLFAPTEGMIVGSTSQGGLLCCPEVFFLPYMELRPFRVNAGAVHSYVYNTGNRTDYMTELRAGSPVMVVGLDGKARVATVGRMKTEVRPLRLIEVEFAGGERVNVIMQDDWHVRIFSDKGEPLNITALKPGDRVMGHVASPGRHVGIKVDENIIES